MEEKPEEKGTKDEEAKEVAKKQEKKVKPGKKKHERLKQEHFLESKHKEKLKDFKKGMFQKGKHLFDRKRKDKFLGGVKGRRGG
jgi:hypothetical protein